MKLPQMTIIWFLGSLSIRTTAYIFLTFAERSSQNKFLHIFVLCKFIRYMKRKVIQNFGKKLLLSLVAVSFLAISQANAQSSQINLGVTLGANYGNLSSNVGSWSGTVGYQAAGSLEWRYNNNWGFALEAQDITLTTNSNYTDSILYYSKTARINYNTQLTVNMLQTTLLFKYYIPLGSKPITPYDNPAGSGNYLMFMVGPYFSLVGQNPSNLGHIKTTSHYVDTTQHDVVQDSTLTGTATNAKNTYNGLAPSVYGITVGAGLNLKVARGLELTFDLRYTRDLATLDNPLTSKGINYGFLGERVIVTNGTSGAIQYNAANAYSTFICFNVGLNIRLFQLGQ